jgi:hypothetical protein
MKKTAAPKIPTTLGAALEGGFYAGKIRVAGELFALILPPKSESGHDKTPWNDSTKRVSGAMSFFDGVANTKAMAKAGSTVAKWALDNGMHIPARDELELLYRAFKSGKALNYCWRGDNPSSEPVGYAYLPKTPARCALKPFQTGGAESFEENWYWSSTQYAGYDDYAWFQRFGYGYQGVNLKSAELRVRAVRRLLIK